MPSRSPVISLPPVSNVQDPAVRDFLQLLSSAWLVRNGHTRETDEKFLTLKDLREGLDLATRGGGVRLLPGGGQDPASGASVSVAAIFQSLTDMITQSRLWLVLGERIRRIETPEWFQSNLGAAVHTVVNQMANSSNALAEQIDTAITEINGNLAIAQRELRAVSDLAGAQAEAITRLQLDLLGSDDISIAAEEALRIAGGVDGILNGSWTVKFDVDGYVTGAGLSLDKPKDGPPQSQFVIRADRFAVGTPQIGSGSLFNGGNNIDTPQVPFVVVTTGVTAPDGTNIAPGVYMRDAMIANATIDTARIRHAAVDTLRVAGQAITVPFATSKNTPQWVGMPIGGASWDTFMWCPEFGTISLPAIGIAVNEVAYFYVTAVANFIAAADGDSDGDEIYMQITSNYGLPAGLMKVSAPDGYSQSVSTAAMFALQHLPEFGYTYISFAVQSQNSGNYTVHDRALCVQVVKR